MVDIDGCLSSGSGRSCACFLSCCEHNNPTLLPRRFQPPCSYPPQLRTASLWSNLKSPIKYKVEHCVLMLMMYSPHVTYMGEGVAEAKALRPWGGCYCCPIEIFAVEYISLTGQVLPPRGIQNDTRRPQWRYMHLALTFLWIATAALCTGWLLDKE